MLSDQKPSTQPERTHDDVTQLNSFLRGELSAVETYGQAIEKVDDETSLIVLRANLESHARRAELVRQFVLSIGGHPSVESGAWGVFARAVEGSAKLFGANAAMAALEEGEDHGLADYRRDLDELSSDARRFVIDELLPHQQRTHDAMSTLKARL